MSLLLSIKHEILQVFTIDPLSVYLPAVETKTEMNPEPFITKLPVEYIRNKEFMKVPWIIGIVQDEGRIRSEGKCRQTIVYFFQLFK